VNARELAEEYCRNGIVVSVDGIEGLILAARQPIVDELTDACDWSKRFRDLLVRVQKTPVPHSDWVQLYRDIDDALRAGPVSREPG